MKMKKMLIAVIVAATFIAGTTSGLFAQQGHGQRKTDGKECHQKFDGDGHGMKCNKLPGITEEQKQKIRDLKTANLKPRTQLKNQIAEKRARLNTLQAGDEVDMKTINKTIDEMTALRAEMQKNMVALHQDIRKLLTDEQRAIYDSHKGKRKSGHKNCGKQMKKDGKRSGTNW